MQNKFGFLNVIKPSGITSHDVVQRIRRIAGIKQVGHGGTLDPMAEGVMLIALGKATRLIQYVQDDKTYLAGFLLGSRTETDDTEGNIISEQDCSHLDDEQIRKELLKFQGRQLQIPPVYSAIKKGGMKLYDLARRGEAPEVIEGREIEIYCIEILELANPRLTARIHCSKGTYIRSIARDLGNRLNVGGCMYSLTREQSGPLRLANGLTLDELDDINKSGRLDSVISSPQSILNVPMLELDKDTIQRLCKGQRVRLQKLPMEVAVEKNRPSPILVVNSDKACLLAMSHIDDPLLLKPDVVLIDATDTRIL